MVIFRENTEDIYAGIEFEQGTQEAKDFADTFNSKFPEKFKKVRFPGITGYGLKPISIEGT
jgi:isocitrate dehydrogenase